MTRASFTAPGANRSITFSDGKGRKNFCINKENGKKFSFSFHFPLIFYKKAPMQAHAIGAGVIINSRALSQTK